MLKQFTKFLHRHRYWLIPIIGLTVLLTCDYLFARAGGGGGFRGGRGGGGSFGGRGGGGGDGGGIIILIWLLIRLIIDYPLIGIPLAIVVIGVFIFSAYQGRNAHVSRTIRKAYQRNDTIVPRMQTSQLQQKDPEFSPERLCIRVREAFIKIQDAWSNQDMKPVRHLISDGIFERFSLQLDMQKASLIRNPMTNIQVRNVRVVATSSDAHFDTIHLRIDASANDELVHLETGKRLSSGSESIFFTEYWSYLRRPGAKTQNKPGLMEGFCPNCGTPIEIADTTECPSCQALINSGEYDWVLAEITQEEEWSTPSQRLIPGLNAIQQKDPEFNVQHLEDRTSVMFYRQIAAEFFADARYINKLATPGFIKGNSENYHPLKNGKHRFYADAAVGAVDVVEVKLDQEGDYDLVRVRVKWSGHQVEHEIPSLLKPNFDASLIYTEEYVLLRKSDAKSSLKNALNSSHCPGCGAPESRSEAGHCEYCHTPLNDGSRDWVLSNIKNFTGYASAVGSSHYAPHVTAEDLRQPPVAPIPVPNVIVAQAPAQQPTAPATPPPVPPPPVPAAAVPPALPVQDSDSLLTCTAAIMLADGVIDAKEEQLLNQLAQSKGVSQTRLKQIVESVKSGTIEIPQPSSPAAAKEFLRYMVLMCLMDGKVTSDERDLLRRLVEHMGYTDLDIQQMIKQERQALYQQAKQINRTKV